MKLSKYFTILAIAIVLALGYDAFAQNPVKVPGKPKKENTSGKSGGASSSKGSSASGSKKGSGSKGAGKGSASSKSGSTSGSTAKSNPTASARPATFSKGLNQWVELTLRQHEVIDNSEYKTNLKLNGHKSLMVLVDTITGNRSLVIDGKRVVDNAYNVNVYFAHPKTLGELVYNYEPKKNTAYMVINGKTYGPYEQAGDIYSDKFSCEYNHMAGSRFEDFMFMQMGKVYRHDVDGTITTVNTDGSWYTIGRHVNTFKSPNGKHQLKISSDLRTVALDGKSYQIIPEGASNFSYYGINCADDGKAALRVEYKLPSQWVQKRIRISNGALTEALSNQVIDYRNCSFVGSDAGNNSPYNMWTLTPEFNNWHRMKPGSNVWTSNYEYTLQDSSLKHTFMSNWEYDYVLIDGNRIGTPSPICAWYDEAENAFAWTAIDGKQLKRYVYKL